MADVNCGIHLSGTAVALTAEVLCDIEDVSFKKVAFGKSLGDSK